MKHQCVHVGLCCLVVCWISEKNLSYAQERPMRTVFVELFEWKWTDIAQECEDHLGRLGFAAVQVSPPNEHVIPREEDTPFNWHERYQPVSYTMKSRSGTPEEFVDMIRRCHAVGVKIYVDVVINAMTRVVPPGVVEVGSAGNEFGHYTYPDYGYEDFHHKTSDGRRNHPIEEWHYRKEGGCASCVRDYEFDQRADLKTEQDSVRETLAHYLNTLAELGVDGFCFDAAQHMATEDIGSILSRLQADFGDLYVCQEVFDDGARSVEASEYFRNGSVTEFKYARHIADVFRKGQLKWLHNFGKQWSMMPNNKAVVFINSYKYHLGEDDAPVFLYILANVFMLAWPYGYPKIVSGYVMHNRHHGPPRDGEQIRDAWGTQEDGTPLVSCFQSGSEWKCVHRWRRRHPLSKSESFC